MILNCGPKKKRKNDNNKKKPIKNKPKKKRRKKKPQRNKVQTCILNNQNHKLKSMHIHTFSCMYVYELRKCVHILVYFTNIFSQTIKFHDMFNTNVFCFGFFFA